MPEREWVRSDRRAEQSRAVRNPKRGRRVDVGFLDTDKIHRIRRDKVENFSAPGSKTSGIPLKNP